jgi:hypothetical protein
MLQSGDADAVHAKQLLQELQHTYSLQHVALQAEQPIAPMAFQWKDPCTCSHQRSLNRSQDLPLQATYTVCQPRTIVLC